MLAIVHAPRASQWRVVIGIVYAMYSCMHAQAHSVASKLSQQVEELSMSGDNERTTIHIKKKQIAVVKRACTISIEL